MAETYATPFLILAALAFVRAAGRTALVPGSPSACCLGAGFLFSLRGRPRGRRLRARRRPRCVATTFGAGSSGQGLVAFGIVAGVGSRTRWLYLSRSSRAGPATASRRFVPTFSSEIVDFYAFAAMALLGLRPARSYGAGAFDSCRRRLATRAIGRVLVPLSRSRSSGASSTTGPTNVSSSTVFPFRICVLAEGLEALRDLRPRWAGSQPSPRRPSSPCALLWNQIRIRATDSAISPLTPDALPRGGPHDTGRLRSRAAPRRAPASCASTRPLASGFSRGALRSPPVRGALFARRSRLLVPRDAQERRRQAPRGRASRSDSRPPRGWPTDRIASFIRLRNIFQRPVVDPADAEISLAGVEAAPGADFSRPPFEARCGPYVLVRTR